MNIFRTSLTWLIRSVFLLRPFAMQPEDARVPAGRHYRVSRGVL